MLDPVFWLAVMAAVLVGLSKGGLPSIGMLAVPLLAMSMAPMQATVLLLPIYIISDMAGLWLYRKQFSAPNLKVLIPAGIFGVLLGWATAAYVSDQVIMFLIGLMGVCFCLNSWLLHPSAHARAPQPVKGFFWGTLAGFTSFISHAGAPPYQVYVLPQKLPKLVFAGTSTILFAVINAAKIVPYQYIRPYTDEMLWQSVGLMPFALLGTWAGAYLTQRIADVWFFRIVQAGLFLVSLRLMGNALGWP